MSKIRGVHGQYDMEGRYGTRPGPNQPKVGPAGLVLAHFQKIFSPCVSHLVLRPKPDGRYAQDQVVIHTARM
jgi:hypothetical protein